MTPMYPALCHKLYRHSNCGIFKALHNKFTNIQSLSIQIQEHSNTDFLTLMKKNNFKLVNILNTRKLINDNLRNSHYFDETCSTQIALNLRKAHYVQALIGMTKSHPIHQAYIANVDELTSD